MTQIKKETDAVKSPINYSFPEAFNSIFTAIVISRTVSKTEVTAFSFFCKNPVHLIGKYNPVLIYYPEYLYSPCKELSYAG